MHRAIMHGLNGAERPRVLVAGGAGFLGAHLCRRLLADGHEVVCVDNFSTGRTENVAGLAAHPRFTLLRHDVVEPLDADVSAIYNLACPASPVHYQADPVHTVRTCVQGTLNLLELAARRGARLLQASTSEVYGDAARHPQSETYWGNVNPVGVRACYDEGKRCAETLCTDYVRRGIAAVRIARIFNTYGPGMAPDDGRVVSNFICQALAGEPLTVYGEGTQTRAFCYVDDLIDGLVRLMGLDYDPGTPVNLGNPQELTMLELAQLVLRLSRSPSRLVFRPLPGDDPVHRCPDIALARRHLDWAPATPVRRGVARTVRDFARRGLGAHNGAAAAGQAGRAGRAARAGRSDDGPAISVGAAGG